MILEFRLPFWIEAGDVRVDIGPRALTVSVTNELSLHKTYWRNKEEEKRSPREYEVLTYRRACGASTRTRTRGRALQMPAGQPEASADRVRDHVEEKERNDNLNAERNGDRPRRGTVLCRGRRRISAGAPAPGPVLPGDGINLRAEEAGIQGDLQDSERRDLLPEDTRGVLRACWTSKNRSKLASRIGPWEIHACAQEREREYTSVDTLTKKIVVRHEHRHAHPPSPSPSSSSSRRFVYARSCTCWSLSRLFPYLCPANTKQSSMEAISATRTDTVKLAGWVPAPARTPYVQGGREDDVQLRKLLLR